MDKKAGRLQSTGVTKSRIPLSDEHYTITRGTGLPRWLRGKESSCQCRKGRRHGFNPWVRKILWRREWQSTPVFLPGESHGQRSLVSHSLWSHKGSETTVPPTPLLSPYGWCAYKERLGHRHTHRRKNRRQAKKRGFRRKSLADILTSDVQPPEL